MALDVNHMTPPDSRSTALSTKLDRIARDPDITADTIFATNSSCQNKRGMRDEVGMKKHGKCRRFLLDYLKVKHNFTLAG